MSVHLGIHMAVANEDVRPAVVVKVEKLYSEPQEGNADRTEMRRSRHISKFSVLVVVIKVVGVVRKVGLDDVGPTIIVIIGGVNAHARLLSTVTAVSHSR